MKRIVLLLAAAALGLSAPASASAQKWKDVLVDQVLKEQGRERGRDDRGRGPPPGESWRPNSNPPGARRELSMSQAIRIVEGVAPPGHHLDGSYEQRGGRPVYRIQWATDRGERRDYVVDAETGMVMGR